MASLPADSVIYNEYHAQIVQLAKTFCRKRLTHCAACPLGGTCRHAGEARS